MEASNLASLEEAITHAALLITSGSPVVAFTGAGISVESGIPDFRSPGGLWSKYNPSVYCNYMVFQERPELFWTMAMEMHETVSRAGPNPAHFALAELESMGLLSCVITQNVDNLHQQAGSKTVYELHGTAASSTCVSCKEKFSTDDLMAKLKSNQDFGFPKCPICEGAIKMDAVLFGEALPNNVMKNAKLATMQSRVLLVIGTSLTVSPANNLVELCKVNHGKVLICDPDSRNSGLADIMLRGTAGDVLPRLVKACTKILSSSNSSI